MQVHLVELLFLLNKHKGISKFIKHLWKKKIFGSIEIFILVFSIFC